MKSKRNSGRIFKAKGHRTAHHLTCKCAELGQRRDVAMGQRPKNMKHTKCSSLMMMITFHNDGTPQNAAVPRDEHTHTHKIIDDFRKVLCVRLAFNIIIKSHTSARSNECAASKSNSSNQRNGSGCDEIGFYLVHRERLAQLLQSRSLTFALSPLEECLILP